MTPTPIGTWLASPVRQAQWRAGLIAVCVALVAAISVLNAPASGPGIWLDLASCALALGAIWVPGLWVGVFALFILLQPAHFEVSGVTMFLLFPALYDAAVRPHRWLRVTLAAMGAIASIVWGWTYSPLGGLLFGWLLLFAWLSGLIVRRTIAQGELRAELEKARRHEERVGLARDMHDVVAGSISHVTMAANELLTHDDLSPEARDRVAAIADEARATLTELRGVIVLLRADGDAPQLPTDALGDIDRQWSRTRVMLESCGFAVEGQLGDTPGASAAASAVTAITLRELGANVLRHGDPAGVVRATVNQTRDRINIVVSNRIRSTRSALPGSGVGITGLRERLAEVGGTLATLREDDQWLAIARIPCHGVRETESEQDR